MGLTSFVWIPIIFCVLIAGLTYFYKLDNIRELD